MARERPPFGHPPPKRSPVEIPADLPRASSSPIRNLLPMPKPTFLHLPVLPLPDSVIDNDIAANPDLPADPCIITIDDSGSESVRPEENDGEGPARPIVPIGAAASSGSGIPHGTLADTLPGTASRASCGASCGDTDIDTDSDGMDSTTHVAAAASGARAASETECLGRWSGSAARRKRDFVVGDYKKGSDMDRAKPRKRNTHTEAPRNKQASSVILW